ncbi:MAG: class I SAM-dependent methyltransferase [Solirubrobacteraceae bacterium]
MGTNSIAEQADGRPGLANDQLRTRLHGMWASVADGWRAHGEFIDGRGSAVTERMFELTSLRAGDRVLELACGPGSVGLGAAARVGPAGEVVVSDVAAEMTAIALERARALGLANVRGRVLDLESIEEPDDAYDVVLCREGLMLALDPARGAREIARVLRSGGRAALAVWGPRERNPWLGLVFDAVSAELGCPVPPPGMPGPFSLTDAGRLAALLSEAGLSQVEISELSVPLRAPTFEAWWGATCALAGPLTQILASLPDSTAERLRARARKSAQPYETRDGLDFPGVTLIASGRR